MKTYLECIPCFFRQALEASKLAGASEITQRHILYKLSDVLPVFSLADSPPKMGRMIYGIVSRMTGKKDPYMQIKVKSNQKALQLYPKMKQRIAHSRDPLKTAVELAIVGNIIDYGVKNSLNVDKELEKILKAENRLIKKEKRSLFQYIQFKRSLNRAKTILYLADNAGEIVFDRLLIEEIKKIVPEKNILFVVKERPTINDALLEDVHMCGIDQVAEIMTNGSDAPGAVLSLCSPPFNDLFWRADLVISKGQGNFESLSNVNRQVFFLFVAKCSVVATHVGCSVGDIILRCHLPTKCRNVFSRRERKNER